MAEPKVEKTTKNLPVALTDEEVLRYGEQLAATERRKTEAENDKKELVSQIKSRIDSLAATISLISGKIETRREWRDVECEETYDYDSKEVYTYRTDTGELVETRRMDRTELQAGLFTPPAEEEKDGNRD